MLLHILTVFLRVFLRNKVHYSLVLCGLVIGFSCFIIMGTYVTDMLNYDSYQNADRIYRVSLSIESDGAKEDIAYSDINIGQRLKELVPEVDETVGIGKMSGSQVIELDNQVFFELGLIKAEPTYFSIFKHQWLEGSADNALADPNSIVLTKALAYKIFGDEDAMSRDLIINDEAYTVKGIIENIPSNTHFKFSGILSTQTSFIGHEVGFEDFCYTYFKLSEFGDISAVERKLDTIYKDFVESAFAELNSTAEYQVEPLKEIHFGGQKLFDFPKYEKANLFVFVGIAFLILALSAMNFINMSLSHYLTRGKEIGMKKILGLSKIDVFSHFFFEGILTTTLALAASILIFSIIAPWLNIEFGIMLTLGEMLWSGVGIVLIIISLFFPFVTASITTIRLRSSSIQGELGEFRYSQSRSYLVRAITVIQIACCSCLLICSLIVRNQVELLLGKDPGYDVKGIVVIDIPTHFELNQVKAFSSKLKVLPSIIETSVVDGHSVPGGNVSVEIFELTTKEGQTTKIIECINVESNFIQLFDLKLLEGRRFNLEDNEHGAVAIVNEAMVRSQGWTQPLTETVNYKYIDPDLKIRVVGVVENFFLKGLNSPIQPLIIFLRPQPPFKVIAKLGSHFSPEINREIDAVSDEIFSHIGLSKSLLDDNLKSQLANETILHRLLLSFAISLTLISVMGLYGATALSVMRQLKQFAIRRVVGASSFSIFMLACKMELVSIAIGIFISVPISYVAMSRWLTTFSNKTPITSNDFLIPMLVIMSVGIIATSFNAIKGVRSSVLESINRQE